MTQQTGIIGDNIGMDLPQSQVPEQDLREELKMVKFSKTAEFKRLKAYAESRIEFYQSYLPDGTPINSKDSSRDLTADWKAANAVIGEFKSLLQAYENAKEAIDGPKDS